ncbi:MAG: arginase family protein [Flavobacteriales bacterium]|nr:arginase family protein [Flavobacteriales bacterium]
MELSHYFKGIEIESDRKATLIDSITAYSDGLDCRDFDLAILYVPENRWMSNERADHAYQITAVLNEFASLFVHDYEPKILNFGEFVLGNEIADTEAGLSEVIGHLVKSKVIPIILGGGRNLTYSVYKSFEAQEQIVNITSVDNYLNLDESTIQNYVGRIIKEQPNFLFNYSNIGYQTYFVSPGELELADELYFDTYRLGVVRREVFSVEPVLRSAEVTSFSMDAIKSSDFGANCEPQPNGIYAEEACQMFRYIGLAEKTKVVLITELTGEGATRRDDLLLAEMLWCVVDGYYGRRSEIPGSKKEGFLKYRVPLRNDEFQLIFYKSAATDRWWMEVPVPPQYANKYRKHHLVPCAYEDYLIATRDDLPERWWKAYKKML